MLQELLLLLHVFRLQLGGFHAAHVLDRLLVEQILRRLALGRVALFLLLQELLARILVLIHDIHRSGVLSELVRLVLLNEIVGAAADGALLPFLQVALINYLFGVHLLIVLANFVPKVKSLVLVSNLALALLLDSLNARVILLRFAHNVLLNRAKVTHCLFGLFVHLCSQVISALIELSLVSHGSSATFLGFGLNLRLIVGYSLLSRGNMVVERLVPLAVELGVLVHRLVVVSFAGFLESAELRLLEILDFVLQLVECLFLLGLSLFFDNLSGASLVLDVQLVLAHSLVLSHTVRLPVDHLVSVPHLAINLVRVASGTQIHWVVWVSLPIVSVIFSLGGEETVAVGRQN